MLLLSRFSRVRLCATPWTAAYQALPPMGFSRQEYWSGVPLPSPTCVQPPPSTLTHHNHPKSIVYIRVHSWCHALYRFGQMYNDMYPSLLLLLFSRSVMSNSLLPHGLQHARLPCPSLFPRVYSNLRPASQWCHDAIQPSHSVVSFSSCLKSFPASGSFPRSQFTSGGESIGVSVSGLVFPMNIQDWFPLGLTGLISL